MNRDRTDSQRRECWRKTALLIHAYHCSQANHDCRGAVERLWMQVLADEDFER